MGSTPSVVSVKFLFGLLLKIGCDRTHKCRYGRDLELSLPPCNASTQSNVSCIWTTNSGHQFVSFPSIDVYTERLQLTEVNFQYPYLIMCKIRFTNSMAGRISRRLHQCVRKRSWLPRLPLVYGELPPGWKPPRQLNV